MSVPSPAKLGGLGLRYQGLGFQAWSQAFNPALIDERRVRISENNALHF